MKQQYAFTLIEVLVALLIFAIVGILTAESLHQLIRTHKALDTADKQLLQIDIAMTLLRRDLSQTIDRPIRDADGVTEPAFTATGTNALHFTTTGLFNPFHDRPESDMQRVAYELDGDNFVRKTWDVLDQPPNAKPVTQILLTHVSTITWQFEADNKSLASSWPPPIGTNMQRENSDLPKTVLMVMTLKNNGLMQGVFPIPARGIKSVASS